MALWAKMCFADQGFLCCRLFKQEIRWWGFAMFAMARDRSWFFFGGGRSSTSWSLCKPPPFLCRPNPIRYRIFLWNRNSQLSSTALLCLISRRLRPHQSLDTFLVDFTEIVVGFETLTICQSRPSYPLSKRRLSDGTVQYQMAPFLGSANGRVVWETWGVRLKRCHARRCLWVRRTRSKVL